MKLSLSWIKDYVKLPEDMDLKKLAYDLTMSTVEWRMWSIWPAGLTICLWVSSRK